MERLAYNRSISLHCSSMKLRGTSLMIVSLLAAIAPAQILPTYTLTNVIGTGTGGYAGDNGAAGIAQLNFPMALARSGSGTLYIADTFNERIRSVQTDGIIRTVVGTGTIGFTGDGGPATAALIYSPYGLATDAAGNLYFSDTLNHTIRKVATNGTITKIAGTGLKSFSGDGGDPLLATMNQPTGIVVDPAGNVLFSDSLNFRIRKIGTDGTISTFAGIGNPNSQGDGGPALSAGINQPGGLALDSAGNLYVVDTIGQRVRKITTDGTITTIAGTGIIGFSGDGGPATLAQLSYPRGVYVDAAGTVFIADTFNNRIRAVTEDGKIQTIAGNGAFGDSADGVSATDAALRYPRAVVPNGSGGLYLLDTDNHRVRLLTPNVQSPSIRDFRGVMSSSEFGALPNAAGGSWIEIYGGGFAQGARAWEANDFVNGQAPTSLVGTSVTVGGKTAFIEYAGPNQVNAQVPDGLPAGTYDVVVHGALGDSPAYKLTVEDAVPGVFAPQSLVVNGKQYAGVFLMDGTLSVSGHLPRPGDYITTFAVGFGPVAPFEGPGKPARQLNSIVLPLKVFVGGVQATVTYAGSAPGWVGLYQINIQVPQVPAGDAVPLSIELNGKPSDQTLYIGVGN
jgi:uncharacterized protein (TIGR03437 family)